MAKQKPFDSARGFISETPGKTDGKFGIGVSGSSAKKPNKKPRVRKTLYMKEEILESLPRDAKVAINGRGDIVMTITYQKPRPATVSEPKPEPKRAEVIAELPFTFRSKK